MVVELILCHSNGGPEGHWDTVMAEVPDHFIGNVDMVAEWYSSNCDVAVDVVYIGVFNWNPSDNG